MFLIWKAHGCKLKIDWDLKKKKKKIKNLNPGNCFSFLSYHSRIVLKNLFFCTEKKIISETVRDKLCKVRSTLSCSYRNTLINERFETREDLEDFSILIPFVLCHKAVVISDMYKNENLGISDVVLLPKWEVTSLLTSFCRESSYLLVHQGDRWRESGEFGAPEIIVSLPNQASNNVAPLAIPHPTALLLPNPAYKHLALQKIQEILPSSRDRLRPRNRGREYRGKPDQSNYYFK